MKNRMNELKYCTCIIEANEAWAKNESLTSINHNMNETHGLKKNIMYV